MTTGKLKALKTAVRAYARALARNDQYRLPAAVDQHLHYQQLTAESIIGEFTEVGWREPKKA